MAIIIETGFEDYDDGVQPNEDDTLIARGWVTGGDEIQVVSSNAHAGVKAVRAEGGAMHRELGAYPGRYVTIQMWAMPHVWDAFTDGGPSLQVGSTVGPGVTPVIMFTPSDTTDLQLNIFNVQVGYATNVVVWDVYQRYRMEIRFSSVNQAGTDVLPDGCCRVYVNDALAISVSGIRIGVTSANWAAGQNYWDTLYFDIDGYIDDVMAQDDVVGCPSAVGNPPPGSNPCCGTDPPAVPPSSDPGTPPGAQPGPVLPPNPFEPLPPWVAMCDGGGVVPSAADQIDSEHWAH